MNFSEYRQSGYRKEQFFRPESLALCLKIFDFYAKKPVLRKISGIVLLAMSFTLPVSAVEVQDLFDAELVARSESTQDREIALKQAFYVVLDRVTVSDDISRLPVIQQMLLNAEHYVKQLQYKPLPVDEYRQTDARQLQVQFDEDQALEQLRKSHVGIWNEIRPETLLWLVVDEGEGKQFYNAEAMPDIQSVLTLASKIKGLPVVFPLLDLEERQKMPVSDIVNVDPANLLMASSRYETPSVLTGQLLRKAECWQGDWGFYFDGKRKHWDSSCQTLKQAVSAGINGVYQILSAYYGVKPDKASGER